MPSLVTSIIGGIQGRSAATHASQEQERAAIQAGQTVTDATKVANAQVAAAGTDAAAGVRTATGNAAAGVRAAGSDAAGAVEGATAAGQAGVTAGATQANGYLSPYVDAGGRALTTLEGLANGPKFEFTEDDPSYRWRLEQGQEALERGAIARGGLQSGGTLKALTRYAQGAASQEYQAAFNRFQTERQNRASIASSVAGMGLTASGKSGDNLTRAAEVNAGLGMTGATTAGGFRTSAAQNAGAFEVRGEEYAGNAGMWSAGKQSDNTVHGADFLAQTQLGVGDAKAAGHIGRANAWSGMLSGIGQAANTAIAGGYSQGGGFKLGDVFKPPKIYTASTSRAAGAI